MHVGPSPPGRGPMTAEPLAGDDLGRDAESRGSLCLHWLFFTPLQLRIIRSSPDSSLNMWGRCCYLGAANHPMFSLLSPARSARTARRGRPREVGHDIQKDLCGTGRRGAAGFRGRSRIVRRKRRADRASGWRVFHVWISFGGGGRGTVARCFSRCFWGLTLCNT